MEEEKEETRVIKIQSEPTIKIIYTDATDNDTLIIE